MSDCQSISIPFLSLLTNSIKLSDSSEFKKLDKVQNGLDSCAYLSYSEQNRLSNISDHKPESVYHISFPRNKKVYLKLLTVCE